MDGLMYGVIEQTVLALLLLVVLWRLSGQVMPQGRARLQSLVANWLLSLEGRGRLQRLGLRLMPSVSDQQCASLTGACSRCGACALSGAAVAQESSR